jgi:hypothetical protein
MALAMERSWTRREILAGSVAAVLSACLPARPAAASLVRRTLAFEAQLGVLFDLLTFSEHGEAVLEVDQARARYRMTLSAAGPGIASWYETEGRIAQGRHLPVRTRALHTLRGREHRLGVTYDYARGLVEYHAVGYTLLLGRRRQADAILPLPAGLDLDDAVSAALNFAAGRLRQGPDGAYETMVVRRVRPEGEGPDDVAPEGYRVEIVPFRFQVERDPGTGAPMALIDLTRWSSWARPGVPARVVFGADGLPQRIESSLILGTTLRVRLA